MSERNHISIREAIRGRITGGEWAPGAMMPGETDLAEEYGCSRTTVNRALQKLAEDGLIERKRRAGTRVREIPSRQAKFRIPILRHEIEAAGGDYSSRVAFRETLKAPDFIRSRLRLAAGSRVLRLHTVHLSDGEPYAFEDRWVNIKAAPGVVDAPFDSISANEWLVREVPYSSGDVRFSAMAAGQIEAQALETSVGAPLFVVERTTWLRDLYITTTKLCYRPGYHMKTEL
ncbi:GntR family transcriptional regulator [Parvularcula marina]|uniref:GntR family transcriptional regulator n=1 Tax=Parvularcula marina TaxID=2292771 RepID=UPI003516D6CD